MSSLERQMRALSGKARKGGNNRSNKLGGRNHGIRKQVIYSESPRILVGRWLTKKGKRLQSQGAPESVLEKYRKNHYRQNPNAKPVKTIYHEVQS